ncbi:MAG TPA: HAMP domain-containing protein [Deltaproteobacteria bacterium]|nr:HAMP domain-containing protein [Deltaproteobacteria bacterium]
MSGVIFFRLPAPPPRQQPRTDEPDTVRPETEGFMTLSIRTRLTLWYVSLLTVTLVASAVVFFYTLSKVYMDSIDKQLGSIAEMMGHLVVKSSGELILPSHFDVILERFFGIRTTGNYIQVLDPSGEIKGRSTSLEEMSLPVSQEALKEALRGRTHYGIIEGFGRYPVRVVTKPIIVKRKGVAAIVQVGTSLEGSEKLFHGMVYMFIFGVAASIIVASWVGWFLSGKALRPVDAITTMARRIGAENLNERLHIDGPKDEIGRLAETFNDMIGRLERSFRQIKQFTADASHELRTPLTVLKGEIEVALRSNASAAELRTILESALEEIDRLSHIVQNLLMLARSDKNGHMLAARVRFDATVASVVENIKKRGADRGVSITGDSLAPVTVMGDAYMLGQLVYNLLENAVKYTPAGGMVNVCLEEKNGSAILTVRDTGCGIAEEDLPHVFDRFYRVDKARTREVGGAGLGLSICKEIVESMKGTIEVRSVYGKGSVFTVRLPLAGAERSPGCETSHEEV